MSASVDASRRERERNGINQDLGGRIFKCDIKQKLGTRKQHARLHSTKYENDRIYIHVITVGK